MLDGAGSLAGPLRVGLMPSICRGLLDMIRAGFVEPHGGVELTLPEATSGALAEAVTAGQLDLAIANAPAAQTALKLRLLVRDPVLLVSGAGHDAPAGVPLRLTDLTDLHLVMPSRQNAIRRLLDARLKAAEVRPTRFVEIDGLEATMRFVAGSTCRVA
jgi:LysR family nitrogen assimilation transcriptional regulator